jgi:hypothetical protein
MALSPGHLEVVARLSIKTKIDGQAYLTGCEVYTKPGAGVLSGMHAVHLWGHIVAHHEHERGKPLWHGEGRRD